MNTEDEIKQLSDEIQRWQTELVDAASDRRRVLLSAMLSNYWSRGMAYEKQGQLKEANADFETVITLSEKNSSELEKDPNLKETVGNILSRCSARLGFTEWQSYKEQEAFNYFHKALEKDLSGVEFYNLWQANPKDVVAFMLYTLCWEADKPWLPNDHWLVDQILPQIKTDPKTVHRFITAWRLHNPTQKAVIADLIELLTWFEDLSTLPEEYLRRALLRSDEDLTVLEYQLQRLSMANHPVGFLGLGHYYFQKGALLGALQNYTALSRTEKFTYKGNLLLNEALKLAPKAIQDSLERGDLLMAANLAGYVEDFMTAAESYELLAKDAEKEEKKDYVSAAHYYSMASAYFRKAGDEELAKSCRRNVHRLAREPDLRAEVDIPQELVLGEWDALSVTIANEGFSSARSLASNIDGPFTLHNTIEIQDVAVGQTKIVEIAIRPNEAGRRVPLTISFSYEDNRGKHQLPPVTKLITVTRP